MEELKALFGESSLSYNEFEQKLGEAGETIKLANLKSGNYVDKAKFDKVEKNLTEYQTKYGALQESTKDYEALKTNFDELNNKYATLVKQQEETNKMNEVNGANVNPKFAKFVCSEVSSLVNDKKDFKTALAEYLKDNKEFLNTSKAPYVDLQSGKNKTESENDKINKQIRGIRG